MGGSNGGLLVGAALTQRPELFGAVVCQVPLLDMRRYHQLLAGASWMGEYGDPDDPEQWAYIGKYSPYHQVSAQQRYPRVLFTTSTRDDRVHPGPRAQDGGADAGTGPRGAVLGKHRRRPCRRGQQRADRHDVGADLYFPVARIDPKSKPKIRRFALAQVAEQHFPLSVGEFLQELSILLGRQMNDAWNTCLPHIFTTFTRRSGDG
jgi:hypothetical protein